uniref:Uncharacterized protein n=1 Tax=Oryza punctata TaxID=4537 RepID=A0A0E0K630_ORYPU
MLEKLRRRWPPRRVLLEAAADEALELRRGVGRRSRRVGVANRAHEGGPVSLLAEILPEGEPAHVELENAQAEAPDVAGVAVVGAVVEVGIDALGAHVGDGPDGGVAGVHGLVEDAADAEVGDLDAAPGVDEEVGGLDVAVDDVAAVEVRDPGEHLARDVGEEPLVGDAAAVEGPALHVLEQDLQLPAALVHAVAPHHRRVLGGAEDRDLARDLPPHGVVVSTLSAYGRPVGRCRTIHTVPPAPLPMRRTRSSSDSGGGAGGAEPTEFGGVGTPPSEEDPDEDVDDGADDGGSGSGSGTASEVRSRCGSGSVRSGRRRDRPGVPGCCCCSPTRKFGGPPGRIATAAKRRRARRGGAAA